MKTADAPARCPKCGDTTFFDPKFCHTHERKDPDGITRMVHSEALKWVCALCSYVIFTPCLDAQ